MLRTLAINSNQIVLSFGVLIAFWSPKQSKIEESSLESMQGVYPDRASGYTIGGHPGNISGQDAIASSGQHSTQVVHIRIVGSAAITPGCRHFTPGCAVISFGCGHFPPECAPPFHLGILHPAYDAGWERMRFNFFGRTYPDHLIAVYPDGRAAILHSAAVFSWNFLIFATNILGYFEIFCFRYLLSKSPKSPCNPPIIGFLSY